MSGGHDHCPECGDDMCERTRSSCAPGRPEMAGRGFQPHTGHGDVRMSETETETGKLQPITLPWLSLMPMMQRLLDRPRACDAARLRVRSTGECEWVVAHPHCSIRWASTDSAVPADDVAAEAWLDSRGLELVRRSWAQDSTHALIYHDGAPWLMNDRAWIGCVLAPADWPANIDDLFAEPWLCDRPSLPDLPWMIGARVLRDLASAIADFGDADVQIGLTSSLHMRIVCGPVTALLARRMDTPSTGSTS